MPLVDTVLSFVMHDLNSGTPDNVLKIALTLSDPGYFVPLACRRWYKKAHPYYFNN